MSAPAVLQEIDELYNFIRIHKWCDQTDSLIKKITDRWKKCSDNEKRKLLSNIKKRINKTTTPEEIILTLVLVGKIEKKIINVIEFIYVNLEHKINTRDFQFLFSHLFDGIEPLPSDISYTLIQRVYLSYKRAVFHALQIRKFKSSFDPGHVALYFVCLLCKDDLNDQNRAVIYYLLSRINTELPAVLLKDVIAYLHELLPLIDDVEKRQEKALSDELYLEEEFVKRSKLFRDRKYDIKLSESGPAASSSLESESSSAQNMEREFYKKNKHKNDSSAGLPAKDYKFLKNRDFCFDNAKSSTDEETTAADDSASGEEYTVKSAYGIDWKSDRENSGQEYEYVSAAEYIPEEKTVSGKKDLFRELSLSEEINNPSSAVNRSEYTVSFDKVCDNNPFAENTASESHEKSVKRMKLPFNVKMAVNKVSPRQFRIILAVFAVILSSFPVYHFLNRDLSSDTQQSVPFPDYGEHIDSKNSLAENTDVSIRDKNAEEETGTAEKKRIWSPSEGESLWSLYILLKNETAGSSDPDLSDWGEFLEYVIEKNPQITDRNLIFEKDLILVY